MNAGGVWSTKGIVSELLSSDIDGKGSVEVGARIYSRLVAGGG